jgi:hypothetical protein
MQQRKRRLAAGIKRLARQVQHDALSLPTEYSMTGLSASATTFAHDVDALGLQPLQVGHGHHLQRVPFQAEPHCLAPTFVQFAVAHGWRAARLGRIVKQFFECRLLKHNCGYDGEPLPF